MLVARQGSIAWRKGYTLVRAEEGARACIGRRHSLGRLSAYALQRLALATQLFWIWLWSVVRAVVGAVVWLVWVMEQVRRVRLLQGRLVSINSLIWTVSHSLLTRTAAAHRGTTSRYPWNEACRQTLKRMGRCVALKGGVAVREMAY